VTLNSALFRDEVPRVFAFHGQYGGRLVTSQLARVNTLLYDDRSDRQGPLTVATRWLVVLVERAANGAVRSQSPVFPVEPSTFEIERRTSP